MASRTVVRVASHSFTFTFAILSLVILLAANNAPTAGEPRRSNLELRLQPEATRDPIPHVFRFEIVNISDHEVHVPSPAIQCEDSFDGALYLKWRFTPLASGAPASDGGGCAGDRFGEWPPILERMQTWKVLQPGESFTVAADRAHPYYKRLQRRCRRQIRVLGNLQTTFRGGYRSTTSLAIRH